MGYDAAMTAITVLTHLIQTHSTVTRDAVANGLYNVNYAAVSEGGGLISFSRGATNPSTDDADLGDYIGSWPFEVWDWPRGANDWTVPTEHHYP
jgi:hypothetical protein